jgi:hypothetical protein
MTGVETSKDRVITHGPKNDGTYIVEFRIWGRSPRKQRGIYAKLGPVLYHILTRRSAIVAMC